MRGQQLAAAAIAQFGKGWVEEDCGYRTPCWIWRGCVNHHGYAFTRIRPASARLAHREAYERARGPIPEGLVIDHLCRVRRCVNPDHLEAVTVAENIRRGDTGKPDKRGLWRLVG